MPRFAQGTQTTLRVCLALALLLTCAVSAQAQSPKDAAWIELQDLAREIRLLKSSASDPAVQNQIDSMLVDYAALSHQFGGDDPLGVLGNQSSLVAGAEKVAPPAPTGSTATTASFSNNTAMPITDMATTTSVISVSTADTYLFDVDLTASITHTFAGDLDITITSPAGTVVTVTTDNGGGNDDVFIGTIFDDSAANTATDFVYADLTPTGPLVPEGAFAAFIGEDPNGDWTFDVFDDAAGDTGSLDSWSLDVTTLDGAPTETMSSFSNNTAMPITDMATASSTISVAGAGTYLCDVDLTASITHTFAGDLDITVTSPAGTVATVTTDNGGGNDDVFIGTVFNDSETNTVTDFVYADLTPTGPLVPEGAFGVFIGEDPNGTWTFDVFDDAAGDTGSLDSWALDVLTCEGAGAPEEIPTVSEWGMVLLLLALGTAGVFVLRRRMV